MSVLLGIALATTVLAANPSAVALDDLARTGKLLVASGDRPKRREKVLEIQIHGCIVTFKTKIMPNGFAAQMIDIGQGSKVERTGRDTVRLRGSTRFPEITVLVSGGETKTLFDELETVRKSCETSDQIF